MGISFGGDFFREGFPMGVISSWGDFFFLALFSPGAHF